MNCCITLASRARRIALRAALSALALVVALTPLAQPTLPAIAQQNTLLNENFEGAFKNDDAGGAECAASACLVPDGWNVWHTRRTDSDPLGVNAAPRYEQTRAANRFRSGAAALRYSTSLATHTGGAYRVITGLTPGTRLKFSAAGSVWSTNDESPISARPSRDIKLKIGIDPFGGAGGRANPFSPEIVWSGEQAPIDAFKDFTVETEARATSVIVYLYSTMRDPVRHNEVFWDDALLTVEAAAATPDPNAPPTPAAAVTAEATAAATTPTPDVPTDDVVHTIVSGDTLLGLTERYNIDQTELLRLNPGLRPNSILSIGDRIVVKKGSGATATPDPAAAAQISVTGTVTGTPTVGTLCVEAFFDENGDAERDDGEDLVPQIFFTIARDNVEVGNYTSDGVNEPYCVNNLVNGEYIVGGTILPIYQPSSPLNDKIRIAGGERKFSLGIRRKTDAGRDVSATATPAPRPAILDPANVLSVVAVFGGLLMIVGLIGFLISAFLRRRRL
jgi:LysM repeat protein